MQRILANLRLCPYAADDGCCGRPSVLKRYGSEGVKDTFHIPQSETMPLLDLVCQYHSRFGVMQSEEIYQRHSANVSYIDVREVDTYL